METKIQENTWKEYFEEKSDDQLKDLAIDLHDSIYNIQCYGVRDLIEHEAILNELDRRGYEIEEGSILKFEKEEEEE